MKRCYQCRETKARDEFYRDAGRSDGLTSKCKKCSIEVAKDRYRARKEAAAGNADREAERAKYRSIRDTAVAIYGGRCSWCDTTEALELDHTDGGGGFHRIRETHKALYRRIATGGARLVDVRLQLLCKPCHHAKGALESTHRALATRGIDVGPVIPNPPTSAATIRRDAAAIVEAFAQAEGLLGHPRPLVAGVA